MWLSLVERCVRDAEVAGSNPVISTIKLSTHRLRAISDACRNCFQQAFSFVFYGRLSVILREYFFFVVLAGMFSLCSW